MGYVDRNLLPGENVIYRTNLHWIIFLWPAIFLFLIFISVALATEFGRGLLRSIEFVQKLLEDTEFSEVLLRATEFGEILLIAGIFFGILFIIKGFKSLIAYATSEFAVTNKRILFKIGFIRRNSLEIFLRKIEAINVRQGIIGRILGYGTITVTGTGGTHQPFHKISSPLKFRKRAHEQIEKISSN
jgi:uncharacterized membrane protein YdbT with pleckstrin-like domain